LRNPSCLVIAQGLDGFRFALPILRAAPICPSGKTPTSRKTPSTLPHKNIPIYRNSDLRHDPAIPAQGEGRSYVVSNVGRGAVDAAAPGMGRRDQGEMNLVRSLLPAERTALKSCEALRGEAGLLRTAKSCGPGRRCYGQALRRWIGAQPGLRPSPIRKATVTKRNSSPGRARYKPSTHCAGKAECSATPVCCCAVSLRYIFAQRTAGASRHPVFPALSSRKRAKDESKTRAFHAARMPLHA
jgi:hypothetical protein